MKELDLRDLDAFVAVARTRNFRRAALEQHVSVSSLSQRLRDMEERLGVRLMNRTTRSVALTEAGELLLARVGPAMSDVGAALDQVRGLRAVPSGRLRINAPPPAIDLVLAPMVAPFLAAHPKIDLEIVGESAFVDIVAEGFDAGVRYGEHLAQDMIAVSLGAPQRYAVVASREYVAEHGSPKHPKDLLEHSCIRTRCVSGRRRSPRSSLSLRNGESGNGGRINDAVARMERSAIRDWHPRHDAPDFAALHPGYACCVTEYNVTACWAARGPAACGCRGRCGC